MLRCAMSSSACFCGSKRTVTRSPPKLPMMWPTEPHFETRGTRFTLQMDPGSRSFSKITVQVLTQIPVVFLERFQTWIVNHSAIDASKLSLGMLFMMTHCFSGWLLKFCFTIFTLLLQIPAEHFWNLEENTTLILYTQIYTVYMYLYNRTIYIYIYVYIYI